jgi:hypothetical protein
MAWKAVLARVWLEQAMHWKGTQETRVQDCGGYGVVAVIATGRGRRRVWSTPTLDILFIGGSTGSAHCGSFRRTVLTATALSR